MYNKIDNIKNLYYIYLLTKSINSLIILYQVNEVVMKNIKIVVILNIFIFL